MGKIQTLSEETIDKIAAGEVVERPASIVKELVENAIDAGATSVTVEIKDGGISFIRITDNGEGIAKDDIPHAFERHATSKLRTVDDLDNLLSLGFRGEALSSIAAISQVELMTKTKSELIGSRFVIEGAKFVEMNEIGVPNGTTIIVKNIFFNTPARRKFLKTATTEASYIADICEHLALSRSDIAFKFIVNGKMRFNTSGSGDLKEVIYRVYGKDIASHLVPINNIYNDIKIEGYLGEPILNRSNRNFEKFFVNNRYIKSNLLSNAVEEGYKEYLMQHKFPLVVLKLTVNTTKVDINVHPTKIEIRFTDEDYIRDFIESNVRNTMKCHEMIPEVILEKEIEEKKDIKEKGPEPFEESRKETVSIIEDTISTNSISTNTEALNNKVFETSIIKQEILNKILGSTEEVQLQKPTVSNVIKNNQIVTYKSEQLDLFEDKIITKEAIDEYKIIGQIFDTYWLIIYQNKLLIMDQHAAHEKVKYESIMSQFSNHSINTQLVNPPIIISLSSRERNILETYKEYFDDFGYEFDDFGGGEIAIRSVPADLYGLNEKEVFLDVLDELAESNNINKAPDVIKDKIATMACKAAVKGNNKMSIDEVWELINELMTLNNPYNCPHGRPTFITMSKNELEKKFKRIV